MTQTATKIREAPNRRTASLPIRSKYDAAQTTGNNRRHWALADALSANAANSPEIRAIIRARARYEMANNSWAKGMALTLAKATIGKGPRLQMNTPNRELNRTAEALWIKWSRRIRLAAKLRTMRMARVSDGEAFGLIGINKGLDSQINLDLRLIEADQIASPQRLARNFLGGTEIVDGIESDAFGNPTAYYVLPSHPGSDSLDIDLTARRIEARQVIHWQREDRPGTHRAVPEITPALPLFAQLRRYTLAVVDAAETAADYSVIFYTDLLPPDTGAAEVPEASEFGTIELERRMATFVPDGWKAAQMKAEQPTTLYDAFVRSIINEIARCLEMPLNNGKSQPVAAKLQDWRVKTVLDQLASEIDSRLGSMPRALREEYSAYWPAFTGQIRMARNDAGHPTSIDPVTVDTVHASLLIFPQLAKLSLELLAWINSIT